MSRIRSIHPGLWTDEAFVLLSPMARLFLMGLWNECDDWGSFAWSPITLKMRILPADSVDASALLAEMEAGGILLRYETGGKTFGAVRNFCQYQRPKKPNSVHPQTAEVRKWVNVEARSTRDGSERVEDQLPTGGELTRQMEDGGGKGSSEANASGGQAADPLKQMFDLGVALLTDTGTTEKQARSLLGKWRKSKGEAAVIQALIDARTKAVSNPVEWLEGRFKTSQWVSASGYEYRGSDREVMREAEKRNDMQTYYAVRNQIQNRDPPKQKERFSTPPVVRQALAAARSGTA